MDFNGLSKKQREVIREGYSRLLILTGGVRAGKTVLTYFMIPELIRKFPNSKGILIGKTLASLSENILDPMRELYGDAISDIKTDQSGKKYTILFGRKVRCVGANDGKAENKIRGATYGWAVGDEVSTWDRSTFDMLMSRLSEKGAICVVTTNPDEPNHWFNQNYIKKEGIDKKVVRFTIDDNPYLDRDYVENLKKIYAGTVLYDRLILGLWTSGSGAIYKRFIEEKDDYIIDEVDTDKIVDYAIGVDFGENVSATTFKLLGLERNYNCLYILNEKHIIEHRDVELLQRQFIDFLKECQKLGYRINKAYCDSAQKTLTESLASAVLKERLPCIVTTCTKRPINERVNQEIVFIGAKRLKIMRRCEWTIKAFENAVYEKDGENRLDEVSPENPVDDLDAIEYGFEAWTDGLLTRCYYGG